MLPQAKCEFANTDNRNKSIKNLKQREQQIKREKYREKTKRNVTLIFSRRGRAKERRGRSRGGEEGREKTSGSAGD